MMTSSNGSVGSDSNGYCGFVLMDGSIRHA